MKKLINQVTRDQHQLLHMQIKDAILDEYYSGNIPEDTPCPSMRELIRKFNTSMVTIDRVFKELKKDNIVYSIPGWGTFWGKKKHIARNNTVGICFNVTGPVNRINSPNTFSMLEGIEDVFTKHDLNIKLLRHSNLDAINNIRKVHCDAFICTGTQNTVLPIIDTFKKLHFPYLILDRPNDDESLNYLERDSSNNIQELVSYLVAKGHRKICCVGLEPELWIDKKLYIGFECGMKNHHLSFSHSVLQLPDYSYESVVRGNLRNIIGKHTALMILNPLNSTVKTILEYCDKNSIKIPADCSIVSLATDSMAIGDKTVTSHMITPYEMGVKAAEGIMTLLNNTMENTLHVEFPLKIQDGNTVRNLSGAGK